MLIGLAFGALALAIVAYALWARQAQSWLAWVGTGGAVVAWALLSAVLVGRGLAAGHWPLTNRYEIALCWAWATLTVFLLLEVSWREWRSGAYVLAPALVVMAYALLRPESERAILPLLPALRSAWFQIHVLSTVLSYGAFGVAAGLALMRLTYRPGAVAQAASEEASADPPADSAISEMTVSATGSRATSSAAMAHPLSARMVERAMDRAVGLGFPWLTLGILTGAIWAQEAWGRYWGWDPKETWALITWLWYLLVLHVHRVRGWGGRRLASLVLIGLGVVFFTFAGVPWLVRTVRLESLHGF